MHRPRFHILRPANMFRGAPDPNKPATTEWEDIQAKIACKIVNKITKEKKWIDVTKGSSLTPITLLSYQRYLRFHFVWPNSRNKSLTPWQPCSSFSNCTKKKKTKERKGVCPISLPSHLGNLPGNQSVLSVH